MVQFTDQGSKTKKLVDTIGAKLILKQFYHWFVYVESHLSQKT